MEIRSGFYVIPILLFFFKFFYVGFFHVSIAVDTMLPGQSLSGKQTLISTGENFALGFFAPGNSQNRYLGIWYNKVSVQTFVWVANRENPITDSLGILKLDDNGNLVVLDGKNSTLWSTNSSLSAIKTTVRLLRSGNLVLFQGGSVLWQSFDHPCDTNLPGMKLGIDLRTGLNRFLTPWKSSDDPFPGNFSFKLDPRGSPEFFILNGLKPYWRSGPWNGKRLSGVPQMNPNFIFNFSFTNNKDEIYFIHSLYNSSIFSRMVLDGSGVVHRLTWFEGKKNWVSFWSAPGDRCDTYGTCGAFATCNINNSTFCKCLQGFEPKSPRDWYLGDWSGGCTRRTALLCGKEDGFLQLTGMKLPDTSSAVVDESMTLEDCKFKCLNNCSCAGYANSDINGVGSGCIIWSGNLIDLQEYSNGGQEFYLRLASSELRVNGNKEGSSKRKIEIIVVVSAAAVLVVAMLLLVLCFLRNSKRKNNVEGPSVSLIGNTIGEDDPAEKTSELPLFDFGLIEAATSNFSDKNKLGEGGFGPVYKGKLPSGEEIAVKRLSKSSGQGLAEFENEVKLIAKLQHRNLARLLGCSIKKEEKLLIYEFMRNKSLDFSLFDKSKNASLDWQKRFHIILGIARGLLYLHEDSRLRIIHRDLKPSNILLDDDFNPKISDFGMARIFGGNQTEANTIKVAGTFGYMSPEYAMDGIFSVKSDVFSFGVLLLEIVCGKKSNGFYTVDDSLTLLGYAWQLWNEGKGIEFVDPSIIDSCPIWEAVRCIHIGLLCVEEFAGDRPNMSSIVFMLGSEATILPLPKQPAFSKRVNPMETSSSSNNQISSSVNNVTITMVESR